MSRVPGWLLRYSIELPGRAEFARALLWPFRVLTLVVVLALAGSFVPYKRVVREGHPWLPRVACTGCSLCGMTRSFCAASTGRFSDAAKHNPGGLWLYAGCWFWVGWAAKSALKSGRLLPERLSGGRRARQPLRTREGSA